MEISEDVFRVYTNARIFYEIATEAYNQSFRIMEQNRTPRGDGGFVISHDSEKLSFKNGLIAISFYSSYIDVHIRLLYIALNGNNPPRDWDRNKTYKTKLESFGVQDEWLLEAIEEFRKARNDIAHEKPMVIGEQVKNQPIRTAQGDAKLGMQVTERLRELLPLRKDSRKV